MATSSDLDRLEALIDQLVPLSKVQTGEPLLAESWNTIVRILIELTRTVLTNERDTSAVPHLHEEEVVLGWLEPKLRTLILEGPLSDPVNMSKVLKIERALNRLNERVDKTDTEVSEVRGRVSEVAVRDLVRESSLTSVDRRIDSISDGRDDVSSLRRSVNSIKADIVNAIEASKKFQIDGELASMEDINLRIKSVESLKARLTNPEGDILDAIELEKRFAELKNDFVTEEELNASLGELKQAKEVSEAIEKAKEELSVSLTAKLEQEQEVSHAALEAKIIKSIPNVPSLVDDSLAVVLPSLLSKEVASIKDELTATVQANLKKELDAAAVIIESNILAKTPDVNALIDVAMHEKVSNMVADEIAGATSRLVDVKIESIMPVLEKRIDTLISERRVVVNPSVTEQVDDLTTVTGIGKTYEIKLKNSGITTYKQLGALTPEKVAKIIGLSVTRVKRAGIIESARKLAKE